MGEAYLADDPRLHRRIALKILPAAVAADADRRRRFEQEAQATARLSHPNIVTLYSIEEAGGVLLLTMEYIDGAPLHAPHPGRPMPLARVLDVGTQIADAISAAHERGVVHRDLKPANILIDQSGRVKVLDFGLAKLREPEPGSDALTATARALTSPGDVVGTVAYMAPEQAEGGPVDHRADIFALGVVLYELATGRRPFEGDSTASIMSALLRDAPPLATDLNPQLPAELGRILRRCLAKDPQRRYQAAVDLRNDLEDLKHESNAGREKVAPAGAGEAPAPRRTAGARGVVRRWWIGFGAGALAVLATAVWFFLSAERVPALTEKDTILLADVVNTTGDAVFDDTLKQALAVALGQSPYLNVYGDSQVRDALRYMNRQPEERITRDVAREICERQALKAMMVTSISSLGSHYVITLEALNAHTGDVLAREQAEAGSKEQVLAALGDVATKVRRSLGESLATIEKFDAPPGQVTTSSLEAFKAYLIGRQEYLAGRAAKAVPFFKRAIELDPNFAVAYSALADVDEDAEERARAAARAFELRDRVAGRERLHLIFQHYSLAGNLDKAIETLQLSVRTYPREFSPRNNLAYQCILAGNYDEAIQQATEGLRLNSAVPVLYSNLGWSFRAVGRYEEAKATFEQAAARKFDHVMMHYNLYLIAFAQGDEAGMGRQVQWAAGKPDEAGFLMAQAETEAFAGHLRQAAATTRRALDAADRDDLNGDRIWALARLALTFAVVGDCARARTEAAAAVVGAADSLGVGGAALAFAVCGDVSRAQALAAALAGRNPSNTSVNALFVPATEGAIQAGRGNPGEAIRLLQKARAYELGQEFPFWTQYLRGQAHIGRGSATEAMVEFQTIVDHRSVSPADILYPVAHLGLARAAAVAGDVPRSRKAYQDFFALWKDADPDIPILQQARREYQSLRQ